MRKMCKKCVSDRNIIAHPCIEFVTKPMGIYIELKKPIIF